MQLQRHWTVDEDVDTIWIRHKTLVQRSTNTNCASDKSMIRQIGSAIGGVEGQWKEWTKQCICLDKHADLGVSIGHVS